MGPAATLAALLLVGSMIQSAPAQETTDIAAPADGSALMGSNAPEQGRNNNQPRSGDRKNGSGEMGHRPWLLAAILLLGVIGVCVSKTRTLRARLRTIQSALTEHNLALGGAELEHRRANAQLHAAYNELSEKERFLSQLTNTTLDGIFMLDPNGHVVYANPAAQTILGYGDNELQGVDFTQVLPSAAADEEPSAAEALIRSGPDPMVGQVLRLDVVNRGGDRIPVEIARSGLLRNRAWHTIGVMRDISERLATEAALAETRQNFRSLVQENRTGILILGDDGTVLYGNPAASQLLSSTPEAIVGMPFGIPSVQHLQTEIRIKRSDSSSGIAAMSVTEAQWQGQFAYLVMLYDITERKQAEERVRQLAFEDSLTGLPNRALFYDRLEEAVKRSRREQRGFALMFMDLNGFKLINDTLGHAVGDELLRAVSQRLSDAMRDSDTLARMGGDEFTAIFPGVVDQPAVTSVANKLLALFEAPFRLDSKERRVGTSIGMAICPAHSQDAEELLRQADSAMYDAKRQQSGGFSLYRGDIMLVKQSRLELEQELRDALLRDEMRLFYQPQVDLGSGDLVAAEALLRWQHPERGLMTPDTFVATLESAGLIVEASRQVLSMACRQVRLWQDRFGSPLPVAVNISPMQVERSDLLDDVISALSAAAVDPGSLILELTETAMFTNMVRSPQALQQLADLGVALHVDNFGTGYGSLEMLKLLPVSAIKIDRSVVAGMRTMRENRAWIAGVVAIAHGYKKRVIAEGIETEAQRHTLEELGCDEGQGYLIGRPDRPEQLLQRHQHRG